METNNANANRLEFQDDIYDDQLEKVVQEFKQFSERIAESSLSSSMKLEDLIDLYIKNSGESSKNLKSSLSEHVQSIQDVDVDGQTQEGEQIIQEMMENTSANDTGRFPESSQTVNINSDMGVFNSSIKVRHIRYGELNCHEAADGIIQSVFGGSIETLLATFVKQNADRTTRRKGIKRKQSGVTETGSC